jgi:hypothetical protein
VLPRKGDIIKLTKVEIRLGNLLGMMRNMVNRRDIRDIVGNDECFVAIQAELMEIDEAASHAKEWLEVLQGD